MRLAERLGAALADGHGRDIRLLAGDIRDPRMHAGLVLAPAAVLVAITDRPEPGLILTQRSAKLRKHPGQIALPGGRVDDSDVDEIAGALREANEEIGLPPEQVEVIGTSDRYHTFTGFDIIPVLGIVPPDLPLQIQESEVDNWFEVPLGFVLDPANRVRKSMIYDGIERYYHEILWNDRRIWGVTAAILANLSFRLGYDHVAA